MADGWIKVYWKLRDSAVGGSALATGVWIHILLRTSRGDRILPTGRKLRAGHVWFSERDFAGQLGVSRKLLRQFIDTFERSGMVKVLKRDRSGTTLSICNWSTYQKTGEQSVPQRNHAGTTAEPEGNRKGTLTEIPKRVREEERESAAAPQLARPSGGLKEVQAYWTHAKLKGSASRFFDFYQAKGWKGIDDWTAQARVWSSRQKDFDGDAMAGRVDRDLTIPAGGAA